MASSPTPLPATLDITFRPACLDDRRALVDALSRTFLATPREQWERLFTYPWLSAESRGDYGTVAVLEGRVVGFLGALYADRIWGGHRVRCCHVLGWWVDESIRGAGLGKRLVDAYLAARPEMPILLLTLRPDHMGFWTRHPIVPFDDRRRVLRLPTAPGTLGRASRVRWLPPEEIERGGVLSDADLRIWRDHQDLRCRADVFRVTGREGACLLVSRRRIVRTRSLPGYETLLSRIPGFTSRPGRRGLALQFDRLLDIAAGRVPSAEVLYASRPALLRGVLGPVAFRLARWHRAVALVGDERRLGLPPAPGERNPGHYYCIPRGVPVDEVDALYAEFLLMDM